MSTTKEIPNLTDTLARVQAQTLGSEAACPEPESKSSFIDQAKIAPVGASAGLPTLALASESGIQLGGARRKPILASIEEGVLLSAMRPRMTVYRVESKERETKEETVEPLGDRQYVRGEGTHKEEDDPLAAKHYAKDDGSRGRWKRGKYKKKIRSCPPTPGSWKRPQNDPLQPFLDVDERTSDELYPPCQKAEKVKPDKKVEYLDHQVDVGLPVGGSFTIRKVNTWRSWLTGAAAGLMTAAGGVLGGCVGKLLNRPKIGAVVGAFLGADLANIVLKDKACAATGVMTAALGGALGMVFPAYPLSVVTITTVTMVLETLAYPVQREVIWTNLMQEAPMNVGMPYVPLEVDPLLLGRESPPAVPPPPETKVIDKRSMASIVVEMKRSRPQIYHMRRVDTVYFGPIPHSYTDLVSVDAVVFSELTTKYNRARFTEGMVDSAFDYVGRLGGHNSDYGDHGVTNVSTVFYMRDWMSWQIQRVHADSDCLASVFHPSSIFQEGPVVQ